MEILNLKKIPRTTAAANALFDAIAATLPVVTLARHFPMDFDKSKPKANDMIDAVEEISQLLQFRLSTTGKSANNRWLIMETDKKLNVIRRESPAINDVCTQLKLHCSHDNHGYIDPRYANITNRLRQMTCPIPDAEPYSGSIHELLGKIYSLALFTLDQCLECPDSEVEYNALGDILIFMHIALSVCVDCYNYNSKTDFLAWTKSIRQLNSWATSLIRYANAHDWHEIVDMELASQIVDLNRSCYFKVYCDEISAMVACNG